jgi:hypothetical protein
MEQLAMTNMMINLKLAEQRQAELAAQTGAQPNLPARQIVRPGLFRSFLKRLAFPRRTRPVQPTVNRMVRG